MRVCRRACIQAAAAQQIVLCIYRPHPIPWRTSKLQNSTKKTARIFVATTIGLFLRDSNLRHLSHSPRQLKKGGASHTD